MKNGKFVISLDFELYWGVRDSRTLDEYGDHILKVWQIIPRLLELFDQYGISATFATVGFLFASDKADLIENLPTATPNYSNPNLSPYNGHITHLTAEGSQYHFAFPLINLVKKTPNQEIGSHTFSHYYCLEEGQTISTFAADLQAAHKIANRHGILLTSIIFPRNQYNDQYVKSCQDSGIFVYRGNENSWFYKSAANKDEGYLKRAFRLLDSYVNISGNHTFKLNAVNSYNPGIVNIPASRFLRPYSPKLRILEPLKLRRIKKSMTFAAQNNEVYHLWWHPHNFGSSTEENFTNLESILEHFQMLNKTYNYTSSCMRDCAQEFLKENEWQ